MKITVLELADCLRRGQPEELEGTQYGRAVDAAVALLEQLDQDVEVEV